MPTRRQFLGAGLSTGVCALAGCAVPPAVDHAAYSTAGDFVSGLDVDAVVERAREAGYGVEGPFYVNARTEVGRPLDVPALTEQFGADARVVLVQFVASATRFFEVDFTADALGDGVRLAFFDDALDFEQPFRPTNLPPDDWLGEQFALLFGLSGSDAAALVGEVKSAAADEDEHFLTYRVDRSVDLAAVQGAFAERATAVETSETQGDGWVRQRYLADGRRFGEFSVVVPSLRVTTTDAGHEYAVKVDRFGGFRLVVTLPPGETLPESEYRGVFRRMFETLGLPAERVDGYDFEYTPSNW